MITINKIKILSAVILAVSTAISVFSACSNNEPPIIPDETVIGTQGEILGVSYYTVENESETQTYLFEITTKKPRKTKAPKTKDDKTEKKSKKDNKSNVSEENTKKANNNNQQNGNTAAATNNAGSPETKHANSESGGKNNTTAVKSNTTKKTDKEKPTFIKPAERPTKKKKTQTTVKATTPPVNTTKKNENNKVPSETVSEVLNGINIVFKSESVNKGDDASIMVQGKPGKKYILTFYSTSSDEVFKEYEAVYADENGFINWTFAVPMNSESGNRKIIIAEDSDERTDYIQTSIKIN